MSDNYDVGAAELKELAGKLNDLLRIRTLPIGMKQFETPRKCSRFLACGCRPRGANTRRANW